MRIRIPHRNLRKLAIALSLVAASRAQAADFLITTADFKTQRATVTAIGAEGIQIKSTGESTKILFDSILEMDRADAPAASVPRSIALMRSGDRLAGEPVSLNGETLSWNIPSVGPVSISMKDLRAILRAPKSGPLPDAATEAPTEDIVRLANGDTVRGIVSDVSKAAVSVQPSAGGDASAVPLENIRSIDFASTGASTMPAAAGRSFRVTLNDGSSLTSGADIAMNDDSLSFTFAGQPRSIPVSSIRSIEQLNGPILWLSSTPPDEDVQTPLAGQHFKTRFDRTLDNGPIVVGQSTFAHGISVHSYSRLRWTIPEGRTRFRTQFAIVGENLLYADVTIRIKLDDKVAFEQANVRAGKISQIVDLQLNGAKSITLEVDYGQNGDVQDRLTWIEPALVR